MEIKISNISVKINGNQIFSNLSYIMNSGDMIALTGASGCGKTTLLNCLGLIQPIESGTILIDQKNATKWNDKEKTNFWHKYATFIYQDYGIIEDESVAYNITLDKSKIHKSEVETILKKVGLSGRANEQAVVLSGGEKQRIGIARAILKNASIIYADEPTASCIYTQKGNKKIRKPQAANQTALIFDRRAAARLLSINSIRRLCWS